MSETPSLSVVERAGLVRLRSEAGDLALAGAGWGAKPTPSEAGVGGRQRRRTIVCVWGWPPRGIGLRRCPLADCGIEGLA